MLEKYNVGSGTSSKQSGQKSGGESREDDDFMTVRQKLLEKYSDDSAQKNRTSISNWIKRYNSAISGFSDYDNKRNGGYTQDASGGFGSEIDSLIQDFDSIRSYAGRYGLPNAQQYFKQLQQIKQYIGDTNATMSKFSNEDDYNTAVRYSGYYQKYNGQTYSQIQDALSKMEDGEEKEWLTQYAPQTMSDRDFGVQAAKNNTDIYYAQKYLDEYKTLADAYGVSGQEEDERILSQIQALSEKYGFKNKQEAEAKIEELKSQNWKYQKAREYRFLDKNDDYGELSSVVSDDKTAGVGIGIGTRWFGQGDPVYDYINNIDDAREVHPAQEGKTPYSIYDYMDEKEIADYNYLYNAQGKEAAQEYLDYLKYTLDQRRMEKLQENTAAYATEHPVISSALSVPMNLLSVAGVLDVAGQYAARKISGEYKPINYNRSSMVPTTVTTATRGTVAKNIADATGTISLDTEKHPILSRILNGKSLGDVYQLGMSMADSAAIAGLAAVGIPGGTALLGGSAASQGVLDALEAGADDTQALTIGILNGVFEMLFEEVSLEKLLKGNTKGIVRSILEQGAVEGSEEFFTTLANTVADIAVMAEKSDYQSKIAQYMIQGLNEKQATLRAIEDIAIGMGWDFVGGMLTGGIMGGSSKPIQNYVRTQAGNVRKGSVINASDGARDKLLSMALDKASESSGKMQGKLRSQANKVLGDNFVTKTGRNLATGRLYSTMQNVVTEQNIGEISAALQENGISKKEAKKIAGAYAVAANGIELSEDQQKLLRKYADNEDVKSAIEKVVGDPESGVNKRAQSMMNFEFDTILSNIESTMQQAAPGQENAYSTDNLSAQKNEPQTASYDVSDDGETHLISDPGKTVSVSGFASIDNGKAMLQLSDGSVVDAEDVSFGKSSDALVYSVVADMGVPISTANSIVHAFDPGKGVSAQMYAYGIQEAYSMGKRNEQLQNTENDPYAQAMKLAWNEGRITSIKESKTAQKAVNDNFRKAKESIRESGKEETSEHHAVLEEGITALSLNESQKASYNLADRIARAAKVDIIVYVGKTGENGYYDPKTDTIHLNLNAMNKNRMSMMAFTLGHELGHRAKNGSPEKFRAFADFLMEQYGKKGSDVNAMIAQEMAAAKEYGVEMTRDEAFEEVVCDACQRMLLDTDAGKKLARFGAESSQNKSIVSQIRRWISEFMEKLREIFSGVEPDSLAAQEFAKIDEGVKQILADMYVDMTIDAGEHLSTIQKALGAGTTVQANENGEFTMAQSKDGSKKVFNLQTWNNGGRETLEATLLREGYTRDEVDAALTIMDEKQRMVESIANELDGDGKLAFPEQGRINEATLSTDIKNGRSVMSALVSNGDYPVNIDLLMVCKKRKAYQRVINRLCETGLIKQATLDSLAIAQINKILGKYGFETACLGCFVESRRLRIQEWANTIVDEWNEEVKKRHPNAKAFGFGKGEAKLTQDEVMQLISELETGGKKNKQGNLNLGRGSAVTKMGVLLDKVPSLRRLLSVEDLITPDGLRELRRFDSNLFSMVKSRYGSASPKFVQEFNPYNSEIAKYGKPPKGYTSLRDYLYAIGGARMQSFSDFIVENWFDYCQIVADLSARKLPMHTYTKEISLAKLFGMTGIKINMSLIPDIDRSLGAEYAGLTRNADGELELIWADKDRFKATGGKSYMQSINFADAVALQNDPRYSGNVGTIAIGISDIQIRMMLNDSRIRMVIPYHSSGINPVFKDMMGISFYKDYTDFQNTTVKQLYNRNGEPVSVNISKDQGRKLAGGFQYNAVLQKLGDARAAAEAYKEWCADSSKHKIRIDGETYTAELTPKFSDFSDEKNYYKLLEDFNTYDCISEKAAPQVDVQQIYPEGFEDILKAELSSQERYRQKQEKNQAFDKAMGEIEEYLNSHTKNDKNLDVAGKEQLKQLRESGSSFSLPKTDSDGNQLSEDQQEFFADSKARDENGNLYVMYHGSRSPVFTEFDMQEGVWLTPDQRYAEVYADMWHSWRDESKARSGLEQSVYADPDYRLYKMYANITNPLDLGEINDEFDRSQMTRLAKLLGVPTSRIRSLAYDRYGDQTVSFVYQVTKQKEFIDIAREKGYDGFTATEKGTKTFCAFSSPNQVKLTTNEVPSSFSDIRYSLPKRDQLYMDAVNRGDMETAQQMVNERAEELRAEVFAQTDVPTYRIRRGRTPQNTINVYKVFTMSANGKPSALFVSSQYDLPVGVWLDAQDTYHFTDQKNGHQYVPSTKNPNTKGGATGRPTNVSDISAEDIEELEKRGYLKRDKNGKLPKTITSLAYRPGWHAGDLPFFPQGGMQIDGSNYPNVHRYNQVVFECEMIADNDYTDYHVTEDGRVQLHDMQEMPKDGSYKYSTNPMAQSSDIGAWYIGSSIKIVRALTQAECDRILQEKGRPAQEWQAYQDADELKRVKADARSQYKDKKYRDEAAKAAEYAYEHRYGTLDLDALGYDPTQTDGGKKLLDAVTYDDDGNVIPLSERFNSSKQDVRYSLPKVEEIKPSEGEIDRNFQLVAEMDSVHDVDAIKLEKSGKKLVEIFEEQFAEWGHNIHSDVFGDIAAKNSSIRSELRHGFTPVKIASIEAIPSVINSGKIVDWIEKNNGTVFRIVVAAPIRIGSTPYIMGVMLQRDNQYQRLYIHDVVVEKEVSDFSQDVLVSTGSSEKSENLFMTSILQNILNVKRQNMANKLPIGEDTSPRALLANAFEELAKTDAEKESIRKYQERVVQFQELETKLKDLRAQIRELYTADGKLDTKKIRELQFEANATANRIETLDRMLLRTESTQQFQNVLKREQDQARAREIKKAKDAVIAFRHDASAEILETMRDYEAVRSALVGRDNDMDIIEREFLRVVKEYEKEKRSGEKTAESLRRSLDKEAKKHQKDNDLWEREFNRMLRQYEKSADYIGVLERRVDKAKQVRDNAAKRDAVGKLQKLVLDTTNWIAYPGKKDVKCPDLLKKPYADFLNSIDLSSKRLASGGDPTKNDLKLASAMGSLATALERITMAQDPGQDAETPLDSGYLDLPAGFVQTLREMTEKIKDMIPEGEFVVSTMTADDVKQLSKMIRTLNHAIREMSTLYANSRFANVAELSGESMSFMDSLGEIEKTSGMSNFVKWDNVLPYYAFKRFGSGGESVFEGLMDAQDKLAFLAQKIFDFQKATWTGDEAKSWGEDTHTINLPSGGTLTLTTADAMSIYCLSRRAQGLQHLLGGGVRVMGIKKGSTTAKDSRSTLSIQDIDAINSSLTDKQKKVAEAIQSFMSTECAEWGNEISMKRFLTREFTEKFYFPIESNDENLTTKDPIAQQSDLFRLLNISATKPLNKYANNEVIIRNIFDVFSGHASDMARLNAFGMPLLDYMKWMNYREKSVNEDGQVTVRGVRKSMEKAFGNAAKSYVLNLIKDVNGRPSDGGDPNILMKWMRSAKTAAVGNSARVAMLQMTSYPRAALVLSPKSLTLGLTKKPNIDRAMKYCGIALWKSFGFYDTNISRTIEEQMKGVKDVKQKLIELSLKGAEIGDALTWGALWNACEYEVASNTKNKVGSEEFYQEVGKKLREVVYSTQVVDSTLTRSQIMRSKRGMAQEAAAFMSEPTLSANILMDAGYQFSMEKRRTGSAQAAWAKTGKYVGRAIAVYSIGQITAAIFEAFFDAWRDDDDEEYVEKYKAALIENLVLDIVPFNKMPVISDVFEALISTMGVGFYSSDRLSTTWITQSVDAYNTWKKVLTNNSSATVYNALYKTTRAISSATGISIAGAMREVVTLWNATAGAYDTTLKIRTWDNSKSEWAGQLLDALVSGNDRRAESLRKKFGDEDDLESAMRSAIKTRYESGEIDYENACKYLMLYGGQDRDEAHWKAEEWKFESENIGEDYEKYGAFYEAVRTGKNLKSIIKEYTDNGVTESTLCSQITSHFKPDYIGMTVGERANIKGYILNAMTATGKSREDAEEEIKLWDFEADYGFEYSERDEAFAAGKISTEEMRKLYLANGNTEEETELLLKANKWIKDNKRTDLSASTVVAYVKPLTGLGYSMSDTGMDIDDFLEEKKYIYSIESDKDKNGDAIAYSRINKAYPYIDSLPLTSEQKTALAVSCGWKLSTVLKNKLW